jgi:hypothetical protein
MSQKDRDLLLEIVVVLDAVTGQCPAEMRRAFHPLIDSVEFITRAMDRDEEWFSHLRIVDRHWHILGEFFETVSGVGRAEFFVAEARTVVKDRGLLERCEWLHREIANRKRCSRRPVGPIGIE